LYFNHEGGIISNYPYFLEELFSQCETLIALHSEDDSIIHKNTVHFKYIYGDDIPVEFHPTIRSREACLTSTKRIIEIAEKYKSRLHVLHVSSLDEVDLFRNDIGIEQKRITAEACTHHLIFSESDYFTLGSKIKWNPSIKSEKDRIALINGLINGKIDIISTDHAPHLIEEKEGNYFEVKSGGPLVQFSLQAILELYFQGLVDLPFVAEKMSHNVARLYKIRQRGFIHEGYFADLVLVDFNQKTKVNQSSILSKCKWSPFESRVFNSKISHTWVNGNLVYKEGLIVSNNNGKRLLFSKTR
jgi:dihydroorotase